MFSEEVNPSYRLVRNEWLVLSQFLSFICVIILAYLIFVHRKNLSKKEILFISCYLVLPSIAVVIDLFISDITVIAISMSMSIFIYFASIQNDLQLQAKQRELELNEGKAYIMLTQIQPHFLYNSLTAIAQLCDEDPKKAKEVTLDFSKYLRSNMESLNKKGLISIEEELNHVKGYLSIEEVVFGKESGGNELSVVYDISAGGFMLPPLTIQPITENAVKHGIGQKEGGGTITISIYENDENHCISIADDGVGYDTNSAYDDNRMHIGIENVRHRVMEQCKGTLEISSKPGIGTTALIVIPKIPAAVS